MQHKCSNNESRIFKYSKLCTEAKPYKEIVGIINVSKIDYPYIHQWHYNRKMSKVVKYNLTHRYGITNFLKLVSYKVQPVNYLIDLRFPL